MGRSKPQDALKAKLEEIYPDAYISDEDYIIDMIEERRYSEKEIRDELGHKPHKMFVDIVLRDSDRTIAFEYHGEQHYSLVGNMTKTTADLLSNQQLDQEKSWILNRIGVPLVAVPFDMYIDERVIEEAIDAATEECFEMLSEYTACPECGRLFPQGKLPNGICKQCWDKAREQEEKDKRRKREEHEEQRREEARRRRKEHSQKKKTSWRDFVDDDNDDEKELSYEEQMKLRAKEERKRAYQAYKESPEYQARKEEEKRYRKEQYQKRKAEMKKQREEEKRLKREGRS